MTKPSPPGVGSTPAGDLDITDPVLLDLRDAYAGGNLIVFVGAGISAAASLPTWGQLTDQLLARMRRVAPESAVAEAEDLAKRGQYVDALSAIRLGLGPQEFALSVEKTLNDRDRDVPEVAQAIAALKPKLRAVLTTNLDHL